MPGSPPIAAPGILCRRRGVRFFKQSFAGACSGVLIRKIQQNDLPDQIAWSAQRRRTDELGNGGTVGY
jgi:hypothetical protein